MAVLMAGAGGLLVFGTSLGAALEGIMRDSFVLERSAIFDTRHMSVQLIASTKEAALDYAREHGIDAVVTEPHKRKANVRPGGYGENFATNRRGAWTH